jgi:hypothetical protein
LGCPVLEVFKGSEFDVETAVSYLLDLGLNTQNELYFDADILINNKFVSTEKYTHKDFEFVKLASLSKEED